MGGFIVHQVDAERAYSRYVKGEPIKTIAESLGVSYNGLRKRWKALGFNTARQVYGRGGVRRIPGADELQAQLATGLTVPQLARAHRVATTELERILRGEAPASTARPTVAPQPANAPEDYYDPRKR